MAKFAPKINTAQFINGIPAAGAKIFTYVAGSVNTKLAAYTDEAGTTPQTNPIILNARGEPTNGSVWLTEGLSYKFVFTASTDTDPPTSPIWTDDDITGINDSSVQLSQWVDSGVAPTYVSATQFTVPGDQTSAFQVNRRIKATVTAGTVYGYITVSAYTSLTTVTVVLDSGTLDSGLSAVQLGLLTPTDTSLFKIQTSNIADDAITTAKIVDGAVTADKLAGDVLAVFEGYINGLTLSTAGSSATLTVASGVATDSTNSALMTLASALNKTTSAWAVGDTNGGLDTGTIANSTWYHVFEIQRPDTGLVDVLLSLSATAPTLPANYTLFRRIGSARTNGSAQWTKFLQDGDEFQWDVPIEDVDVSNPGTSAVTRTLTVPTGVRVKAHMNVQLTAAGGAGSALWLSDLSSTDNATSVGNAPIGQLTSAPSSVTNVSTGAPVSVYTNTSAQVRSRVAVSDANTLIRMVTTGWVDTRGKN